MEGFITELYEARRAQRHSCRSLAAAAGITSATVSRVERSGKGCVGSIRAMAGPLGLSLQVLTARGKLLMYALDSKSLGTQLRRYRVNVLRKTRKQFAGVSSDIVESVESNSDAVPIEHLVRYSRALGLDIGLIKRRSDIPANIEWEITTGPSN